MSTSVSTEVRDRLLASARQVMDHAYAPYSKFRVGAAILTGDDKVFTGCNVENASYGLTICAERNAIFAAVTAADPKNKLVIKVQTFPFERAAEAYRISQGGHVRGKLVLVP